MTDNTSRRKKVRLAFSKQRRHQNSQALRYRQKVILSHHSPRSPAFVISYVWVCGKSGLDFPSPPSTLTHKRTNPELLTSPTSQHTRTVPYSQQPSRTQRSPVATSPTGIGGPILLARPRFAKGQIRHCGGCVGSALPVWDAMARGKLGWAEHYRNGHADKGTCHFLCSRTPIPKQNQRVKTASASK